MFLTTNGSPAAREFCCPIGNCKRLVMSMTAARKNMNAKATPAIINVLLLVRFFLLSGVSVAVFGSSIGKHYGQYGGVIAGSPDTDGVGETTTFVKSREILLQFCDVVSIFAHCVLNGSKLSTRGILHNL
jgi:hypothetical protein